MSDSKTTTPTSSPTSSPDGLTNIKTLVGKRNRMSDAERTERQRIRYETETLFRQLYRLRNTPDVCRNRLDEILQHCLLHNK